MNRTLLVASALLTLSAAWLPLQAADPAPKDLMTTPQLATPQATEITSNSMEMWSTDTETHGVFVGNVAVTGTNLRITCDRLEITATRLGDKTDTLPTLEKFKFLLATGKVRIVQGDREANCGRAEVYPREDRLVLMDNPVVVDHGTEVTYTGKGNLELFRGQRRVRGEGVQITGPSIKDLGFDKNEPAPKAEPPAATDAPAASPAPAPAADSGSKTPPKQ